MAKRRHVKRRIVAIVMALTMTIGSVSAFAETFGYSITIPGGYDTVGYTGASYAAQESSTYVLQDNTSADSTKYYIAVYKNGVKTRVSSTGTLPKSGGTVYLSYNSSYGGVGTSGYYLAATSAEEGNRSYYTVTGTWRP